MILEVALQDAPVLRQKAKPILHFSDSLQQFVNSLVETMISLDGWGLAAPQVFRSERIFAMSVTEDEEMDPFDSLMIFINPELLFVSEEKSLEEEACLSLPDLVVPVLRPNRIKVKGQTLQGKSFTRTLEGMEARCFLHELDHLNGVLISDYITKEFYAPQNRSE